MQNISQNGDSRSSTAFTTSSWTAQFYLLLAPNFQDKEVTAFEKLFRFTDGTSKLNLDCYGIQDFSKGRSDSELRLHYQFGDTTIQSHSVTVPFGEWLIVTV